jgi:hypothetical protein
MTPRNPAGTVFTPVKWAPQTATLPSRFVVPADSGFDEVVLLIEQSRERAMQAVNAAVVELYWQIGALISHKISAAE